MYSASLWTNSNSNSDSNMNFLQCTLHLFGIILILILILICTFYNVLCIFGIILILILILIWSIIISIFLWKPFNQGSGSFRFLFIAHTIDILLKRFFSQLYMNTKNSRCYTPFFIFGGIYSRTPFPTHFPSEIRLGHVKKNLYPKFWESFWKKYRVYACCMTAQFFSQKFRILYYTSFSQNK